jgi:hypothetical protein
MKSPTNYNFGTSEKSIEKALLFRHYHRRYTLPFVSTDSDTDTTEQVTISIPSHKTQNYVLSDEELENQRPFMRGQQKVRNEIVVDRLVYPAHAREILSEDEQENERPFMHGRNKLSKEVLKARGQAHVYEILSDDEWENERPFMHGRNKIPREVVENRRFLQLQPVLGNEELENERPFMSGRNELREELEGRRHQRRLIDLFSDAELEGSSSSGNGEAGRKRLARRRRFLRLKGNPYFRIPDPFYVSADAGM